MGGALAGQAQARGDRDAGAAPLRAARRRHLGLKAAGAASAHGPGAEVLAQLFVLGILVWRPEGKASTGVTL